MLPPSGHWSISVQGNYGRCLQKLQHYEEAETELLESYSKLLAALGEDHELTQKVAGILVDLYDSWDKPVQAAEWRTKLSPQTPKSP